VTEKLHVALRAHHTEAVQVGLKSVSDERYFTSEAEAVYRLHLASNWSGATVTSCVAPPANALQAVKVSLKSVSKEGHFTLDNETVFRPYLQVGLESDEKLFRPHE
jgi:hypothetical protein